MPQLGGFDEVLTLAVADLTEHGYDSAERVAYWQERLARAARESLRPEREAEEALRASMTAAFRKLVDQGGALRTHPGVSRFRLDMIQPRLRVELDRRVAAAADLIRLNRQQSIARTQQRFAGWATSIPPRGVSGEGRRKKKQEIKKALSSLSFEERRLMIDQGHKLAASVNRVIAEQSGAIAVIWRSHWRQPGYNYRPDHKERDQLVYLLRSSWARDEGLVKPGPAGVYEDVTAVGQEPFCRCYGVYVYALRDLPEEMLTKKGREALEKARAAIGRMSHAA